MTALLVLLILVWASAVVKISLMGRFAGFILPLLWGGVAFFALLWVTDVPFNILGIWRLASLLLSLEAAAMVAGALLSYGGGHPFISRLFGLYPIISLPLPIFVAADAIVKGFPGVSFELLASVGAVAAAGSLLLALFVIRQIKVGERELYNQLYIINILIIVLVIITDGTID